jgi:hypothetical protein
MRRARWWKLLLVVLSPGGCELAEVAAPAGEDVLLIESVLRVGARQQYVIWHRSMAGRLVGGVPGATVTVSTPGGERIPFIEADLLDCLLSSPEEWQIEDLRVEASCYLSARGAGRFVHPGRSYELRVETSDGRVARGRTEVPGAYTFRVPEVYLDPYTLTASCKLPEDEFTLAWTRAEGAWSYIASMHLTNWGEELRAQGVQVPDPLELTGVAVSAADTTILFPTNLGLFQRAEYDQRLFAALRRGIPASAEVTLVVLAADRNYTNAIRGGRFNPSGNVRAGSVVGEASGVFGSVVPLSIRSTRTAAGLVPAPCPMPPEPAG